MQRLFPDTAVEYFYITLVEMEFDVMDVKQISSKKMSHGGGY
jgi:hypothetical protein